MSVIPIIEAVMIATQGMILILLLVVVYRVIKIRRELENITEQVKHYCQIVTEPDTEEHKVRSALVDDEGNRLLSAVLQEIFP